MNNDFDVAIIGGGLVGLATACALSQSNLKIAVIDPNLFQDEDTILDNHIGIRASAINHASQQYFKKIGIWDNIYSSKRFLSFSDIEVWEKEGKAKLAANCYDFNFENLGYIIENKVMQYYLSKFAHHAKNVTFFYDRCIDCQIDDEFALVRLGNNNCVKVKLIIGADGASSWIRQAEKIGLVERDYLHHAVITTVKTERTHQSCARQLFYRDGIVAFLPLFEQNKSCLVWSARPDYAKKLQAMSEQEFCDALFELTGDRVGHAELINQRMVFPLKARLAHKFVKHRLVLIGDAAHTIHPLAGQGVNLGFQDSAMLVSTIKELNSAGKDIGISSSLKSFQFLRRKDTLIMMTAMQTIQDMFNGSNVIKKAVRMIGMNTIDCIPPLKKQVIKYALNLK